MRLTHYDEHKKRWQINDDYGAVMIDELNYAVGEAIDKLAAYEDAEEQGLLVRLLCKVGDTVYELLYDDEGVRSGSTTIDTGRVYAISVNEKINWISVRYESGLRMDYTWDDISKTVFLTREAAEAALKGENGEE